MGSILPTGIPSDRPESDNACLYRASCNRIKSDPKVGDGIMVTELNTGNSETRGDLRERPRFSINAPVTLNIGETEIPAYTRDMSSRGLYFYVASVEDLSIGQTVDMLVKLPPEITLSTCCSIRCRGRLVRMENAVSNLTGIAAEILQYLILSEAAPHV
jgi:hypothetical protein